VISSATSSSDQLIAAADQALYQAKGAGRDRIAIAEPRKPILPNAA
jgi:PleD family two-component response regulator